MISKGNECSSRCLFCNTNHLVLNPTLGLALLAAIGGHLFEVVLGEEVAVVSVVGPLT